MHNALNARPRTLFLGSTLAVRNFSFTQDGNYFLTSDSGNVLMDQNCSLQWYRGTPHAALLWTDPPNSEPAAMTHRSTARQTALEEALSAVIAFALSLIVFAPLVR